MYLNLFKLSVMDLVDGKLLGLTPLPFSLTHNQIIRTSENEPQLNGLFGNLGEKNCLHFTCDLIFKKFLPDSCILNRKAGAE